MSDIEKDSKALNEGRSENADKERDNIPQRRSKKKKLNNKKEVKEDVKLSENKKDLENSDNKQKVSKKTKNKVSKTENESYDESHEKNDTALVDSNNIAGTSVSVNDEETGEEDLDYANNTDYAKDKKFPIVPAIIGIFGIVVICVLLVGYVYFKSHWYPNTILNGTDISYKNIDATLKEFNNVYDNYSITLKGRDEMSATVKKADIDMTIDADSYILDAFDKQHEVFYIVSFFKSQNLTMKPQITYSEEKLNAILASSELLKGSEGKPIIGPHDACPKLDNEKGYFVIAPEIEGNTLDPEKFNAVVKDQLSKVITEVNLDDKTNFPDMFKSPKIRKDEKGLQEACDAYNATVLRWVNWKMNDKDTISITPQDIMQWYTLSDDFKVTLNEQAVDDYIERFCLKYKTVGKPRNFKTHSGNVITVSGGDYGWQMNYNATLKQIKDVLNTDCTDKIKAYMDNPCEETKAALTTNYDVVYKSKGHSLNTANAADDYDHQNYSEISLSEQCVYVYKGGQCVYTAHCITGLPTAERATPKGVYYIKERLRNKTLTGPDYSTPVSYWARITWEGVGFHDATWQAWGAWSPSSYTRVGSHGCINLSMNDVAKIYSLIAVGDPVFIY